MAEIKQTLGFNASKAIDTLNSLEASMRAFKKATSSTVKVLGSFNKKADKTEGILKRLKTSASNAATQMANLNKQSGATKLNTTNKAATQAASAMDKVGAAASTAGTQAGQAADDAAESTRRWTISWETLGRVVVTQAIVRTLNAIRNALSAAVTEAIAFQKAVAEIGTIAGGLGGLEKIEDMTRRVSDTFNVELADATEAAYQTVSNQIASTEKDVESFLGSAAKFAKITKTDMTTAVNLLSGTLNAFGKDVSETEDVAAKFFNTIKLGRTRAEELAQSLGSINPIASKLGITMEELNAAVATLTIQGLKTDKVITQIRGVMQSFLKPTEAMIDAMAELGFETGEQIFEAYDLQEALRAVIATTDGSAAAVAKLVPRIRGLTGGIGLAKDESNHFTKSMKEQKDALGEVYDKAYHLIITTDAEKVTKALRQLKNVFIDVFGQKFLSGVAQVFGVLEGLTTSEVEHITKAYDERGKAHADLLTKELQNEKDGLAERSKLLAQYAAVARKEFIAAANAAEDANKVIAASTQWAIDSMMNPIETAVKGIEKAVAEAQELMEDFADESSASLKTVQKTVFARAVGAADDPNVKLSMLRRKSAEESLKAQVMAASATTKAELDAAKQLQASSRAYNDQAFAIAKSIKQKYFNGKAIRDLTKRELELQKRQSTDVTQDMILRQDRWQKSHKKGEETVKSNTKSLSDSGREIVKYKANLDILIEKMQEAQEIASDKDLTPEDQVKLAKEAQVAVDKYLDFYAKGVEKFAQSADPLIRKLYQAIEAQDMTVEIDTIMTLPSNMQEIFGMIRDAADDFFKKIPVEIQLFAEERELAVDTPKQVDEVMRQYNQTLEEQATALNATKQASAGLENELKKIDSILGSLTADVTNVEALGDVFGALSKGPSRALKEIADKGAQFRDFEIVVEGIKKGLSEGFSDKEIQVFTKQLENLANRGFKSVEALQVLNDALIKLPALEEAAGAGVGVGQQELAISNMLKTGELQEEQIQKALEETRARNATGAAIDANKAKTDAAVASQKALTQATTEGAQAAAAQPAEVQQTDQAAIQLQGTQAAVTAEVGNTTSGVQQMTSQLQAADGAAQQLLGTLGSVSGVFKTQGPIIQNPFVEQSRGGRVGYFANGGRGTDTIPAMLSAGEHVTNARSSQRFFSQLQAMNAGQQPVFRNDGGDTYNTNVGDINVSGAGKPAVVAREVMKAIRREERRGSGR